MLGDNIIDAIFGTLTDEKTDLDQYKVTEDSIEVPDEKVQGILDEMGLPLAAQLKKLYGVEAPEAGVTDLDEVEVTDEDLKKIYAELNKLETTPSKVIATVRTAATVYIHTFDGKTTPVVLKPGNSIKVMTKDGYVCAMISMDKRPPVEEVVEAAPTGTRIVEV